MGLEQTNYEIDTFKLKRLNETLLYLIRTNRFKLSLLNDIAKTFEADNKLDLKAINGDNVENDFDHFNYSFDMNDLNELSSSHLDFFFPNRTQNRSKI